MGDGKSNTTKPFTSKFLTPCRTFGLKRKTTPNSGIKSEGALSTEKENPPPTTSNYISPLSTPKNVKLTENLNLTPTETQTNIHGKRLHEKYSDDDITDNLNISKGKVEKKDNLFRSRRKILSPDNYKNDELTKVDSENLTHNKKLMVNRNNVADNERTGPMKPSANLLTIIKRVNIKVDSIKRLKQAKIYTKKHNLIEIGESTNKWLNAIKMVLPMLVEELEEKGKNCTMLDILKEHNILPEMVGFNIEMMDFD